MSTLKEREANLVKIAVVILSAPGKVTQFIEMDQDQPLCNIIQRICVNWDIPDPENYILQTFGAKNQYYITDSNKGDIKKGSILRLEVSPAKNAQDVLIAINNSSTFEQYAALAKLSYLSVDLAFAEEFIKQGSLTLLINNIEQGKYKDNALKYAIISVIELMRHGILTWDVLEEPFINKIASYVNKQPSSHDTKIVECCLSILEKIVRNSSKDSLVEKKIIIHNLIQHLQLHKQDCKFQQYIISLINAILSKADITRKAIIAAMLSSKQCRSIIHENLFGPNESTKTITKRALGTELLHQLYVLQTLMLGLLEPKMRERADVNEQESRNKIKELRKTAFGSHMNLKVAMKLGTPFFKNEYQKMGFGCEEDEIQDFNEIPPGVLALDCMLYFAKNYSKDYKNIIHKNSCRDDEYEFHFGKTSVELVKLLCSILHIGEQPCEQGLDYYPMIFSHEKPFEEMFCVCVIIINKMWVEMRAKSEDMPKVLSVAREQIIKALSTSPRNFEEFREKVNQKSFAEITRLWQRVRNSCRKKMGNFV